MYLICFHSGVKRLFLFFIFYLFVLFAPPSPVGKKKSDLVRTEGNNTLLKSLTKIKPRYHLTVQWRGIVTWAIRGNLGISEAQDFPVSIWQHLYKDVPGCQIRNTNPFVWRDLNFAQCSKWLHDKVPVTLMHFWVGLSFP